MPDQHHRLNITIWGLLQAAALLALLAGVYASSHTIMVAGWFNDDYSYCFLLPPIIGWILWDRRGQLLPLISTGGWAGLIPMVLGALLYTLGEFGGEYYSQFFSSWLMLLGLCWLFLGQKLVRALGFVFLLLFTMMPLPQFLNNRLTVQLQLLATRLGEALIRLMGMSVYREGNIIDLGFMQLQVVEACSGLRYLFPLIVLSLVLTYFTRLRLWQKCLLVASAIPISLVLNSLRIAVTALASRFLGPQVAEGFSHDFAGWIIFVASFCLLFALSALLARLSRAQPSPAPAKAEASATGPSLSETPAPETESSQVPAAKPLALGAPPSLRFLAAAALLAAVLFGATGRGGVEVPVNTRPFSEFPMQFGSWTGRSDFLDPKVLDTLKLSQYVLADYEGPDKIPVSMYVAYYKSQPKGQAIHSPESCMPGTGWSMEQESEITLQNLAGTPQPLNRIMASKGGQRILTYFWFAQHGKKITTLPMLKLSTLEGAILRGRTDGALVRLSTPLTPHEPAERADARLQQFLRDVEPVLREFVPE